MDPTSAAQSLSPATKEIVDAVGTAAPHGQLTPEAAEQLLALARRLEAGASVFEYGMYALLLLALAYLLNSFRCPRLAAIAATAGFGCALLVPYVQFTVIGVVGVIASLVVIFRRPVETNPA